MKMVCIVCPKGCQLTITNNGEKTQVTGQGCKKGPTYALQELAAPVRVLTSTVEVVGSQLRLPVKTSTAIPKSMIMQAMGQIIAYKAHLPIKTGQVLIPHFLGTEANLVATANIQKTVTGCSCPQRKSSF